MKIAIEDYRELLQEPIVSSAVYDDSVIDEVRLFIEAYREAKH